MDRKLNRMWLVLAVFCAVMLVVDAAMGWWWATGMQVVSSIIVFFLWRSTRDARRRLHLERIRAGV